MGKVFGEVLQWTIFIKVNINGINPTWLIIAQVIWSLPYEWLFYFALPFIGLLFLKKRVPLAVLVFSLSGMIVFLFVILSFYQSAGGFTRLYPFLGGIAAAFLVRVPQAKEMASGPMISICIVILLLLTVYFYPNVYEFLPLLLLSLAFIGIACGNSLFGLLTHPLSRSLGQISYSIYLLHGILLFGTFQWVLDLKFASSLTHLQHWAIIALCSIALIVICGLTYSLIENPSMDAAPAMSDKWKKKSQIGAHLSPTRPSGDA